MMSARKDLKITTEGPMQVKKKKKTETQMFELLKHPHVQSWRAIMNAYQQIYRYLENELLKNGCSIPRFQIFFYLYFQGPMSSNDLSKLMHVTRGNISTFLGRLLVDKLVYLTATQERGGKQLIHLSSDGRGLFESFFPEHIQRVINVTPKLSQATLKKFNQIQL